MLVFHDETKEDGDKRDEEFSNAIINFIEYSRQQDDERVNILIEELEKFIILMKMTLSKININSPYKIFLGSTKHMSVAEFQSDKEVIKGYHEFLFRFGVGQRSEIKRIYLKLRSSIVAWIDCYIKKIQKREAAVGSKRQAKPEDVYMPARVRGDDYGTFNGYYGQFGR